MRDEGLRRGPPLTWAAARRGFVAMLPLSIFIIPFAAAFGAAAVVHGLSAGLATLMSAVVFAGASQFSALDFWRAPLPTIALLITVFMVNGRHFLLGAAIYPWLAPYPLGQRILLLSVMTDANWAWAVKEHAAGEKDAAVLGGSGLALWIIWVPATWAGAVFGQQAGDLKALGFDVVMPAFFATLIFGMWQGPRDLVPWGVAGGVALAGTYLLPTGWHIMAGALAGGLAGALRHGR